MTRIARLLSLACALGHKHGWLEEQPTGGWPFYRKPTSNFGGFTRQARQPKCDSRSPNFGRPSFVHFAIMRFVESCRVLITRLCGAIKPILPHDHEIETWLLRFSFPLRLELSAQVALAASRSKLESRSVRWKKRRPMWDRNPDPPRGFK